MTQEEIIRLVNQSGGGVAMLLSSPPRIGEARFTGNGLERFVALVAAAECPSAYREVTCTAIRAYQCCACGGFIQRGKIYLYQSGVWGGEPRDFITCTDCVALRKQVIDDRNEQLRAVLDALSKRCYIMSESHQVNGVLGARLIVGFNNVVDAGDAHSAISALNGGAA